MSDIQTSDKGGAAYYKKIIGDLPLEVKYLGENKGYGLFVTKDIEKVPPFSQFHLIIFFQKQILFSELPLISIQHPENKRRAFNCGGCYKYLGSLGKLLVTLLK
jgi:hypothetical protein